MGPIDIYNKNITWIIIDIRSGYTINFRMNSESPGLVASSLTIVSISNPKLEQRYWNYVSILYSNDVYEIHPPHFQSYDNSFIVYI
jgi:hypothetical protein